MQAHQIRDKYKRILEEPEEEDSDDQWEIAYSHMTKQRKRKILSETNQNSVSNGQLSQNSQTVLNLKQKLAQCLSNCKQHCKEIEKLKRQQLQFDEERKEWRSDQNQFDRIIQQERNNVNDRDQRIRVLQRQNQEWAAKFQELMVEKDLQNKQAEFYKAELGQLKIQLQRKQRQFKHCEKDFRSFQRLKKDNEYLKSDVQRLSFLVEDSTRFGRISSELMKKHFLGKPYRQIQMWYPQHLVGQVQLFLKKSQVGHGNRQFTHNLIKFVEKVVEKAKEQHRGKTSYSCSKPKESISLKKSTKLHTIEGPKKNSCTLSSLRDQHLTANTRAMTNSYWRVNDSRITSNNTSNISISIATIKSQCWDIVNSFREIVFELLLQKDVKKKKIKKLIDSMSGSLMDLFDTHSHLRQFSFSHQGRNQFRDMRIVTEDNTTAFK